MGRIYLDHNATTPLLPEARAAIEQALDLFGNPSSVHAEGRAARGAVERARASIAEVLGADARNVIFTSGATEANNAVLRHFAASAPVMVSASEHVSVLEPAGPTAHRLPVGADGLLDLDALDAALAEAGPGALASVQLANNETGIIQPIPDIAALVHASGAYLHVDAVQGVGRIPVELAALGAEYLTLSAHKLGGPKGVGALVLASQGLPVPQSLLAGGGQERRRRAGTENVLGIAGFGAAVEATPRRLAAAEAMRALRDWFEGALLPICGGTVVFGGQAPRLPNTLCVAVPGIGAEKAVIALDLAGIAVGAGAACSSGRIGASHVLAAMGVDRERAAGALRISLSPETRREELEQVLDVWRRTIEPMTAGRARRAA
jgi:cysteine desulfurase